MVDETKKDFDDLWPLVDWELDGCDGCDDLGCESAGLADGGGEGAQDLFFDPTLGVKI